MAILIQIIFVLSFVFVLYRSDKLAIGFIAASYFFFPLFMLVYFNSDSERVDLPINIMLLLTFLVTIVKKNAINKKELILVIYIPVFLILVALFSLHTSQSPVPNVYFFRNLFFNLMLFPLLVDLKKTDAQWVMTVVGVIILIQILLSFLQYQIPSISKAFTIETVETNGIAKRRLGYGLDGANLVTGTLLSMANLASILTIFILFLTLTIKKNKFLFNGLFIIIGLIAIIFTGVRSPLGALILVLGLFLVAKRPLIALIFGLALFALYGLFSEEIMILSELASNRTFGFENPFLRMAGLLSVFQQSDSTGLLTFGRTVNLYLEYDIATWIGNATDLLIGGYDSPTDAFLILLIIDYGWIVLLMLLLPYFVIIKNVNNNCPREIFVFAVLCFIMLLTQTIVDEGLWYNVANFLFVLILGLQIAIHKNEEHNHIGLRAGELR